jgi:hypothetical protein
MERAAKKMAAPVTAPADQGSRCRMSLDEVARAGGGDLQVAGGAPQREPLAQRPAVCRLRQVLRGLQA